MHCNQYVKRCTSWNSSGSCQPLACCKSQALQEETGRILELQAQLAAASAQPPQPQHSQQRAQPPQHMPQPPEAAAGLDPVADSDVAAPSSSEPDRNTAALSGPGAAEAGSSRQLEAELQQAQAELRAARSQLEAEAAANRAKQKLLAKEVCMAEQVARGLYEVDSVCVGQELFRAASYSERQS